MNIRRRYFEPDTPLFSCGALNAGHEVAGLTRVCCTLLVWSQRDLDDVEPRGQCGGAMNAAVFFMDDSPAGAQRQMRRGDFSPLSQWAAGKPERRWNTSGAIATGH